MPTQSRRMKLAANSQILIPDAPKSPLEFHVGEAMFRVGGFIDATAFFRSTNLGSGIGTAFGSIPYSNSNRRPVDRNALQCPELAGHNDVYDPREQQYQCELTWRLTFLGSNPPTALSPATLTVSGCGFIGHRSHTAELSFLEVSRSV